MVLYVKFIYSEKATKFCEISTLFLSNVVPVKSKVEILQNFVAFSENMNFTLEQSWFKLEKIIGIYKPTGKVRNCLRKS